MLQAVVSWLEERTGLVSAARGFFDEEIPASSGWHQVFGSVAMFLLMVQTVTGILLALDYAPQPGAAYNSLQYIINEVPAGRLIRGLHHWGASFMVVVVVIHMVQVGVWGAYKKPREATWIAGVALLLLTLGFGLTGYLLPWDNRAYWSTVVTVQILGLAPGGSIIQHLVGSDGGRVGVGSFARFYTLHTVILPAVTFVLAAVHLYLVRLHGVAPQPEDQGRPTKKFYPEQVFKDTVAIFVVFALMFGTAVLISAPLERLADPTDLRYVPRPEWYFLFLFQTLKLFEGPLEIVGAVVLPALAVLALVLVPFLDRRKLRPVARRIVAIATVGLAAAVWFSLTAVAIITTPPAQEPAGGAESAGASWTQLPPVDLVGLSHYTEQRCDACHNLAPGGEPKSGPTLANVGAHRSADWMIEHFRNPAAVVPGTPMPPANLTDAAASALSAFLLDLTPQNAEAVAAAPPWAVQAAVLYEQNSCGACHVVNGAGQTVGPPLNGVSAQRDAEWLAGHFRDPQQFSPGSMMPAYQFNEAEMKAMVDYMLALPGE